jgi:hypothetical protein
MSTLQPLPYFTLTCETPSCMGEAFCNQRLQIVLGGLNCRAILRALPAPCLDWYYARLEGLCVPSLKKHKHKI